MLSTPCGLLSGTARGFHRKHKICFLSVFTYSTGGHFPRLSKAFETLFFSVLMPCRLFHCITGLVSLLYCFIVVMDYLLQAGF